MGRQERANLLLLYLLFFGGLAGCSKPFRTVARNDAIADLRNSKICILSFTFDPRVRDSIEGTFFSDTPEHRVTEEQLTRRLAEEHFNSTIKTIAAGFHVVPTKFADVFGEAPGAGSDLLDAHPRFKLSRCTDLSQAACLAQNDHVDEKTQISRLLSAVQAGYGLVIWDQFGLSSIGYSVLSRTEIVNSSGEVIWKFGGLTAINDTSAENIINETFFLPTSIDHIVEVHEGYMKLYPILVKGLLEEDINRRPHQSSLAEYAGLRNPIKSFYMPQVAQTED